VCTSPLDTRHSGFKTATSLEQLLAEIKIHRSVSHQYIVGFESFFEDNLNVYMMLEVCPNQVRGLQQT